MAEKDIYEKALLSYADAFADCGNALIYDGKQLLQSAELQPAPTESFYHGPRIKQQKKNTTEKNPGKNNTAMRNQFCDVSFYRVKDGVIKAQYIIGNETRIKKRQILRKTSYQGGAYRGQLESGKPTYPVLGIVLDWTHKSSRIPLSLKELLKQDGAIQDELERIDEVNLQVFHMKNLSSEVRRRFNGDMGFVVDYLNEGSFENRKDQKILHLDALCEMMQAITGDIRFTEMMETLKQKQEESGEAKMCEYFDMLEAIGEKRGITIGEKRGIAIGEERGIAIGEERGITIGEERGIAIGEERGIAIGEERGKGIGENRLAKLIQLLLKEQKLGDIALASSDSAKRRELYHAYGI